MKALKALFVVFLFIIILGGVGYIGWSYLSMGGMNHQGNNMNTAPSSSPTRNDVAQMPNMNNMPNMQNGQQQSSNQPQNNEQQVPNNSTQSSNMSVQSVLTMNTLAVQNKEKLTEATETINQAIELITYDPYSKATLPTDQSQSQSNGMSSQGVQGSGTVNIYPSGSGPINITPGGAAAQAPSNSGQGNMNAQQQAQHYVYDQGKLQQLHNGIYTLAQGMETINDLSEDLLTQSSAVEEVPATYQTYVQRYNLAFKNKTKLETALNMLNQASVLINVNPYAAQSGYPYQPEMMSQLHQGIYKIAQGVSMLKKLNEDFANQMIQTSTLGQMTLKSSNQSQMTMPNMTSGTTQGHGLFGNLQVSPTTVLNIILVVLLLGLIFGVLGAIFSMLSRNRHKGGEEGK